MQGTIEQITSALLFYGAVVGLFRIAGKRFAGQTTTFDLIILISLSVALQQVALGDGSWNAIVFVASVFTAHLGLAAACRKWSWVRELVRGTPSKLIDRGEILYSNLRSEGLTTEELNAGLRKLGLLDVSEVEFAHLEETGQISATKTDQKSTPQPRVTTEVAQPEF